MTVCIPMKTLEKSFHTAAVSLVAVFLASGCATLVSGSHQQFKIDSTPPGAKISYNGKEIGTTPFEGPVPRTENAEIVISLDDYETKTVNRHANMNPMVAGNLVSFFVPGVIVDISTGAFYKFKNPTVEVTLKKTHVPSHEFWRKMLESGAITKEMYREKTMELRQSGKIDEATMREELLQTK